MIGLGSPATLPRKYTTRDPGSHIFPQERREKSHLNKLFTKIYIFRPSERACAEGRVFHPQLS